MIEPGTAAPDFTLRNQDGDKVALADLRGRTVLLVFYPMDFSPACSDQLSLYEPILPQLNDRNVAIFGISIDHPWAHKAFQEKLGVSIPLLADFNPRGEVARAYGALIENRGHANRSLVLIDGEGTVAWVHEASTPIEIPPPQLILAALEAAS